MIERTMLLALMFLLTGLVACTLPSGGGGGPAREPQPARALPQPREPVALPADHLGAVPEGLGIHPGSKAPSFQASNLAGKSVTLEELLPRGPILLVFYRGGWCPFCNFQIHELAEAFPRFQSLGVLPVAVSVDVPEAAALTASSYEIPFPVLSDPDASAHEAFRVVHQAGEDEVQRLRGYGMDLETWSGRDHHKIAVPSIFLIARDGTVLWAHVDPEYKRRPSAEQVLGAAEAVLGGK